MKNDKLRFRLTQAAEILAAHGYPVSALACRDAITEIERLEALGESNNVVKGMIDNLDGKEP